MSNRRTIFYLALLTLVALAANIFLSWRAPQLAPRLARQTLLDPSRIITSVELSRPGEPATELAFDGRWRLVKPYAGTVDAQVVLKLLDILSGALIEGTQTAAEYRKLDCTLESFHLDAPFVRMKISDGANPLALSLGDYTATSNGVYATLAGSDTVLVVPAAVRQAADVGAAAFRERALFPYGPEFVTGFDLRKPGDPVRSFVRTEDGWKVGDEVASAAKVRDFLARLTDANATDFVWPTGSTNEEGVVSEARLVGYGLDAGAAVSLYLRCRDGADRRILLGNDVTGGKTYALVHNGSAIVSVDATLKTVALEAVRSFADARLFPLETSAVNAFTLVSGETSYVVARGEGGAWRLDAPVSAPADAKVANGLLERLLALTPVDIASDGISVSVSTNRGPFTVSPKALMGAVKFEDLRSSEILSIDATLVKRLVSTKGGKKPDASVAVVHSRERKTWNVESESVKDRTVDAKSVASVLSALAPLRAARIVTLKAAASDLARYGLDAPFHTLAVDQEKDGSVRRNIFIGAETRDGRFATVGSAEAIFVLPASVVKILTSSLLQ